MRDMLPLLMLIGLVVVGIVVALVTAPNERPKPIPRQKTPEELARDAAWYRAEGNALEARQEYLLKHAGTSAN